MEICSCCFNLYKPASYTDTGKCWTCCVLIAQKESIKIAEKKVWEEKPKSILPKSK